jgi:hypothetical protein
VEALHCTVALLCFLERNPVAAARRDHVAEKRCVSLDFSFLAFLGISWYLLAFIGISWQIWPFWVK